jgi:hypothetical protein
MKRGYLLFGLSVIGFVFLMLVLVSALTPLAPSVTVISPNGGESWQIGTTQTIKWSSNIVSIPENPVNYDISLIPYYPPCVPGTVCVAPSIAPFTIAVGVTGSSYGWSVGKMTNLDTLVPDGSYTVRVCQSGTNTCDSGDSSFTISIKTNATACSKPTCEGVYDTFERDMYRCPIYACPTNQTLSCNMPTCVGAYDTGKKDNYGCPIYACPPREMKCEVYSYNECPSWCEKKTQCIAPTCKKGETCPAAPCQLICATPSQKEVYLNQKFELKPKETAKVIDYKNMEIKYLSMLCTSCPEKGECTPSCQLTLQVSVPFSGGTSTTETTTSTTDTTTSSLTGKAIQGGAGTTVAPQPIPEDPTTTTSGGGGGGGVVYCEEYPFAADCICKEGKKSQKPCNPPVDGGCAAVVSYECLKDSSGGGGGGRAGTVFDIAPGEKKEVFGATITLLRLQGSVAVLVVEVPIIIKPVCGNGICEAGEGEVCAARAMTKQILCEAGKECKIPPPLCRIVCPQDCSGRYDPISILLGEKFKLHIGQTGVIKEEDIRVIFKNMIASRCEETVVSSQASATAIKEKVAEAERTLTGSVVSDLSTDKPVSVLKCVGAGPKALISYEFANERRHTAKGEVSKVGVLEIDLREKKRIGDIFSIAFLDYDYASRTGVFLINKEEFICPIGCKCDDKGNTIECVKKTTCEEGKILCPDGECRDKCPIVQTENCSLGCNFEGKCFPMGVRSNGMFCGTDLVMNSQKDNEQICENNFECSSNVCVSGKCISKGLVDKIIDFFRRLFGAG